MLSDIFIENGTQVKGFLVKKRPIRAAQKDTSHQAHKQCLPQLAYHECSVKTWTLNPIPQLMCNSEATLRTHNDRKIILTSLPT